MADISKPLQEQQKYSRQIELYDEQEAPVAAVEGKRCLKVILTDGHLREAVGFEFAPIPWLGTSPELILSGQITVMNGLLFLTPQNCTSMHISGGKKDDIEITEDFLDY